VAEEGIGRATHRAIAARAGVPLGATTYYFPTLDDLLVAGMQCVAEDYQLELARWAEIIASEEELADALTQCVLNYLSQESRVLVEYELYLAAARNPTLRPLADVWLAGLRDLLVPQLGVQRAEVASALIDGMILQSLVTGVTPHLDRLEDALRLLEQSD
jgi:DNA-binding transcriptional regulator YbjK